MTAATVNFQQRNINFNSVDVIVHNTNYSVGGQLQ